MEDRLTCSAVRAQRYVISRSPILNPCSVDLKSLMAEAESNKHPKSTQTPIPRASTSSGDGMHPKSAQRLQCGQESTQPGPSIGDSDTTSRPSGSVEAAWRKPIAPRPAHSVVVEQLAPGPSHAGAAHSSQVQEEQCRRISAHGVDSSGKRKTQESSPHKQPALGPTISPSRPTASSAASSSRRVSYVLLDSIR